jgi:hypothetical protein
MRSVSEVACPCPRRRLGSVRPGGARPPRHPAHRSGEVRAGSRSEAQTPRVYRPYAVLRALRSGRGGSDRTGQHPPDRARAGGHRAHRATLLGDHADQALRLRPTCVHRPATPTGRSSTQDRRPGAAMFALGLVEEVPPSWVRDCARAARRARRDRLRPSARRQSRRRSTVERRSRPPRRDPAVRRRQESWFRPDPRITWFDADARPRRSMAANDLGAGPRPRRPGEGQ